jgi:hydrogenase maturation protease
MTDRYREVVIGVGNEFRRDDGAGPAVVDRLRGEVPANVRLTVSDGEPAGLLEAWTGADLAIVVDAVISGAAPPGRLYRVLAADRHNGGLDDLGGGASTHSLGLGTAVGLSRALGRLPAVLIVHAVEGADFGHGPGLSAEVGSVIDDLVAAVLTDLRRPPRPGIRAPRR